MQLTRLRAREDRYYLHAALIQRFLRRGAEGRELPASYAIIGSSAAMEAMNHLDGIISEAYYGITEVALQRLHRA
jgi:hypothetical protein